MDELNFQHSRSWLWATAPAACNAVIFALAAAHSLALATTWCSVPCQTRLFAGPLASYLLGFGELVILAAISLPLELRNRRLMPLSWVLSIS